MGTSAVWPAFAIALPNTDHMSFALPFASRTLAQAKVLRQIWSNFAEKEMPDSRSLSVSASDPVREVFRMHP